MSFHSRFPRVISAALLALALGAMPSIVFAGGVAKRPVVVELYTSQGCNSCPPADALLGQLAARKDVIAMSLPITYWDMLGWKDTLANEANTRRQKAYADVMGHGGVYTPQMIVDGISDVVGSRDAAIASAIGARAADEQSVPIVLSANRQQVHVAVGFADPRGENNATIWFFRILPQATVTVGTGENGGHTLTYRNVVRDIKAVGIWKGQPVVLDLPRQEMTGASRDSIAIVVQQSGYGRVVGAAMIDHPEYSYIR